MPTLTVRISVEAAKQATGFGSATQHIIEELRVNGIPAVKVPHGIDVEFGKLEVYDEPQELRGSLRVFEWNSEADSSPSSPSNEEEKQEVAVESTPVNTPPAEKKRKK
jgi:hypothetical protein